MSGLVRTGGHPGREVLTVLLSVAAHGLSATPLAARYGKAQSTVPASRPGKAAGEPLLRRLTGRP
ncbi:MAG: hypothetical protein ACRDV1_03805 [Actinomycetes bacterium]